MELLNYLNGQQSVFLKSANYEIGDNQIKQDAKLNAYDSLEVKLIKTSGIEIIFTRKLAFEPESSFKAEVSMGTILYLNQEKCKTVNWEEIDLAQEIKACPKILNKLVERSSLLIAQLTSSFGGNPVITPPHYIEN